MIVIRDLANYFTPLKTSRLTFRSTILVENDLQNDQNTATNWGGMLYGVNVLKLQ